MSYPVSTFEKETIVQGIVDRTLGATIVSEFSSSIVWLRAVCLLLKV